MVWMWYVRKVYLCRVNIGMSEGVRACVCGKGGRKGLVHVQMCGKVCMNSLVCVHVLQERTCMCANV